MNIHISGHREAISAVEDIKTSALLEAVKEWVDEDALTRGPGHYEYEFVHDEILVTFRPENRES